MENSILKILHFNKANIYYIKKSSMVIILNTTGIRFLYTAQKYYINSIGYNTKMIFTNKNYFISFYSSLYNAFDELLFVRSIKMSIRGLGFRIYPINDWIYNIIFNWINNIYLFCSSHVIMRIYRKKILLLSRFWYIVKSIVYQLLNLRELGPYELRGFKIPRSFLFLKKPRKKSTLSFR